MPGRSGGGDHEPEDHPDLGALAGEMRAEWRAEQEAAAADAAAQWRHGRTIADWLRDRMHAGDRIAASCGARGFAGVVDEVGDDLVVLRDGPNRVEIHVCATVPVSFELIEHARAGGTSSTRRRTFRDALLARDGRRDVEVGTLQQPHGLTCRLYVGADHVVLEGDGGEQVVVPLSGVAWVAVAPA